MTHSCPFKSTSQSEEALTPASPEKSFSRTPGASQTVKMKAAVMNLVLLIVAYAESQEDVPARPAPILLPDVIRLLCESGTDWNEPIYKPKPCTLGFKPFFANIKQCSGYVDVGFCSGNCYSTAQYNIELHKTLYTCTCCREKTMAWRIAYLACAGGRQMEYKYKTIASCACKSCSSTPIPA